jgi:Flp pilus assembly pilin Flp
LTEIAMRRPPLSFGRIRSRAAAVRAILRLTEDCRGVTAIEYALIASLIAMAFVALITAIGDFVSTPFDQIASYL